MNDVMALMGGGLVCWSLGHFIGWWSVPLTFGMFLVLAALLGDIIEEMGK